MAESRYLAVFTTGASTVIEFDADVDGMDDATAKRALEEAAYQAYRQKSQAYLCHQCARHITLGDFDLMDDPSAIEAVS